MFNSNYIITIISMSKIKSTNNINKNMNPILLAKLNRGHCLWCGDKDNIFQCGENPCQCTQYTPSGKYGSKCVCGHGEIWHHHNNNFRERLNHSGTITKSIGHYIGSLKKRLSNMEEQNKALLERVRNKTDINQDGYLCSVCMKNRRDTVFLPCKHAQFCETCSKKWLEKHTTCPICRKHVECILDIII